MKSRSWLGMGFPGLTVCCGNVERLFTDLTDFTVCGTTPLLVIFRVLLINTNGRHVKSKVVVLLRLLTRLLVSDKNKPILLNILRGRHPNFYQQKLAASNRPSVLKQLKNLSRTFPHLLKVNTVPRHTLSYTPSFTFPFKFKHNTRLQRNHTFYSDISDL